MMLRDVVNVKDEIVGSASAEQIAAERLVCRVVFVMLVNRLGELILHRRSNKKASYPLYWSGSAAGHVKIGESYDVAARRELKEELGVETRLEFVGKFFSAEDREMVAVYFGRYDGPFQIEATEVDQVRCFSVGRLQTELPSMKATSFLTKAFYLLLPRLLCSAGGLAD